MIEKILTERQKLLLKIIKNLPAEKGVIITCSGEIQDRMAKRGETLTRTYIPCAIRVLAGEGLIKSVDSVYLKKVNGQRLKIVLCKKKKQKILIE